MPPRVLHILSQRPLRTGSGITLDALVSRAQAAGYEQRVICAAPAGEPVDGVGGLGPEQVDALAFETPALPMAIPGMSDVMPYRSTVFSSMSAAQIDTYVAAWRNHVEQVVRAFQPDLVHVHHLWLVASIVAELVPASRIVAQCHGTGLRQLALCPHLADRVRAGCARIGRFVALHGQQRDAIAAELGVSAERVTVAGAGYRQDLFHPGDSTADRDPAAIVYAGKYSAAKGLPWLLDAVDRLAQRREVTLHIAGAGGGDEGAALRARMDASPHVRVHGMLSQPELAALLRRSTVFTLPSMYEGLPLVLIEAIACGCRAVATDLPGTRELSAHLNPELLTLVETPQRVHVDQPVTEDLPRFVDSLQRALETALDAGPATSATDLLAPFTWDAVFDRVQAVWRAAVSTSP